MAHICPTCGKQLSRSTTLRQHVRTHTGERPFSCRRCPRRFARPWDLTKHEETHEDGHQFHCRFNEGGSTWGCGKGFRRKSDLTRHLNRAGAVRQCMPFLHTSAKVTEQSASVKFKTTNIDLLAPSPPKPANCSLDNCPCKTLVFYPAEHSGPSIFDRHEIRMAILELLEEEDRMEGLKRLRDDNELDWQGDESMLNRGSSDDSPEGLRLPKQPSHTFDSLVRSLHD
jgi:uncharacterized Zn-finger protein